MPALATMRVAAGASAGNSVAIASHSGRATVLMKDACKALCISLAIQGTEQEKKMMHVSLAGRKLGQGKRVRVREDSVAIASHSSRAIG